MTKLIRNAGLFVLIASVGAAPAFSRGFNFTTQRGAVFNGSTSVRGTTATGSGSVTTANGAKVSGSGTATYHPASNSVTASGEVTGPQGNNYSADVTAADGSATVTGGEGKTKTFTRGTHNPQ